MNTSKRLSYPLYKNYFVNTMKSEYSATDLREILNAGEIVENCEAINEVYPLMITFLDTHWPTTKVSDHQLMEICFNFQSAHNRLEEMMQTDSYNPYMTGNMAPTLYEAGRQYLSASNRYEPIRLEFTYKLAA